MQGLLLAMTAGTMCRPGLLLLLLPPTDCQKSGLPRPVSVRTAKRTAVKHVILYVLFCFLRVLLARYTVTSGCMIQAGNIGLPVVLFYLCHHILHDTDREALQVRCQHNPRCIIRRVQASSMTVRFEVGTRGKSTPDFQKAP